MSEFLHMGGYGSYVWSAMAIFIGVLETKQQLVVPISHDVVAVIWEFNVPSPTTQTSTAINSRTW